MSYKDEIHALIEWEREQIRLIDEKYPNPVGLDGSGTEELRKISIQSKERYKEISDKYKVKQ